VHVEIDLGDLDTEALVEELAARGMSIYQISDPQSILPILEKMGVSEFIIAELQKWFSTPMVGQQQLESWVRSGS